MSRATIINGPKHTSTFELPSNIGSKIGGVLRVNGTLFDLTLWTLKASIYFKDTNTTVNLDCTKDLATAAIYFIVPEEVANTYAGKRVDVDFIMKSGILGYRLLKGTIKFDQGFAPIG